MRGRILLSAILIAGTAAPAALAAPGHHWWFRPNPNVYTDEAGIGKLDLGIDISRVGSTPADVGAFVNSLPARTQSEVWGGCQTFLAYPGNVERNTLGFCRLLVRY